MKNPLQTAFNAVLLVAVAALFFLHFRAPQAPTGAAPAAAPADVAVAPTASTLDAPAAAEAPADTAAAAGTAPDTAPETAVLPTAPVTEKIAYVESGRMLDGYQGMKDARRAFEVKARGWERQNAALVTSFRTAVEDYQKKAPAMTPELRATSEARLQQMQQESGQQQEKLARQAQEEESKLTQTVLSSVNKKVEAYGKARGYTLILIAAPSGTIAYGRKDLDITGPVLAYLNQQYRK